MKIIAVIELDQWFEKHSGIDPLQNESLLKGLVSQCKQWHFIDVWRFTLAVAPGFSALPADTLGQEVILQPQSVSDPLNSFYETVITAHDAGAMHDNSFVLRIKAGAQPLSPLALKAMIENHKTQGHHYSRNHKTRILDDSTVEIMNFSVLREAWREALLPDDRIEVTPYIYRQQQRLNLGFFPPVEMGSLQA